MPLHFLCFLFCYYIYLFAFVFSLCHPHHAVVIQRKEVDCPALPKACTCTQDSKGPPGPAGPPVRHTHTHTHFGYWASLTSAALHFIVCLLTWMKLGQRPNVIAHLHHNNDTNIIFPALCHITFYSHYFLHVSLIWWRTITKRVTFWYHCQKHHDSTTWYLKSMQFHFSPAESDSETFLPTCHYPYTKHTQNMEGQEWQNECIKNANKQWNTYVNN